MAGDTTGDGTHGEWDQVAEAGQLYEGELMAGRLRQAGFEVQVVDQTFHQDPIPTSRSFNVVRVLVPKGRVEEARKLLAETPRLSEDVSTDAASDD